MTYGAVTSEEFALFDGREASRAPDARIALCALGVAACASFGFWAMHAPLGIASRQVKASLRAAVLSTTSAPRVAVPTPRPAPPHVAATSTPIATPTMFARVVTLRSSFRKTHPAALDRVASVAPTPNRTPPAPLVTTPEPSVLPPLPAVPGVEHEIPMPLPRPIDLSRGATPARPATAAAAPRAPIVAAPAPSAAAAPTPAPTAPAAAAGPSQPSFFDKMFGSTRPTGPALAYAAPEDGGLGVLGGLLKGALGHPVSPAPYDQYTAVYNIAAHTVTLPDGTRLEAHSGLGAWLDNPNGVSARMRGATPPNLYELRPREALFHGVRALRMTPVGSGQTYGRAGLLTHSYMLRGREGESNGCVVFKDYEAFLRAYDAGMIRRLAVVAGGAA